MEESAEGGFLEADKVARKEAVAAAIQVAVSKVAKLAVEGGEEWLEKGLSEADYLEAVVEAKTEAVAAAIQVVVSEVAKPAVA